MTDKLRAAAQAALEALVIAEAGLADIGDADREPGDDLAWCEQRASEALDAPRKAINELRAALAEPEAEPVAWGMRHSDGRIYDCIAPEEHDREPGQYTVPLYTAPPRVEPEVEQKPVAWMDREGDIYPMPEKPGWAPPHTLLYAAPPRREWVSLTDEEIARILGRGNVAERTDRGAWVVLPYGLARAIEAVLKERNHDPR